MNADFQFDLTDELLARAARKYVLRRRLFFWGAYCTVLVVAIVAAVFSGDYPCVIAAYSVVLVLGLASKLLFYVQIKRAALKYWRQVDHRKVVCRVTDDAFEISTAHFSSETPWRLVEALWRFSDIWLVHIKGRGYTPVPTEVLSEDVRSLIEQKVRENGGKVK